jgi:hypothetical protein
VFVVTERMNVAREVRDLLSGSAEEALEILPAFAGEVLAAGDPVAISDLKKALGMHLLQRGPNPAVADAVLAMVRTYTIGQAAHFSH